MRPLAIPTGVTTIYLYPCKDGYLQIDTSYPHEYGRYRRQLAKKGIDLHQVKYLLLTHHHDDHAGFLNDLTRDTPVRILAHREAVPLLRNGKNDMSRGGGYVNRRVKALAGLKKRLDPRWKLTFPPFDFRETAMIVTGDDDRILRELDIPGRVIYTPGHCIDHLSIVLDTGEAFCGDAASSFLLWAGTHYCTLFMTNMVEAYRSWMKLIDAGAKEIFPAHGKPFLADRLMKSIGRIKGDQLVRFF